MFDRTSEQDTLTAMDRFGGSFVRQLATVYRLADPVNRALLLSTFAHYFREYDDPIWAPRPSARSDTPVT